MALNRAWQLPHVTYSAKGRNVPDMAAYTHVRMGLTFRLDLTAR